MYSKSGESKMANTYEEHLDLKKKGWGHTKPKRKLKGLHAAKYFIGGLISGIKGAKESKKAIAKAEADRQAQLAKEEELRNSRQKLTMSPEIEKMKEGLGGTEIQRRQEAAERARAGAMAAATRGGTRVDPFAAARAGQQQESALASEQAAAQRKGLQAGVTERGKLRDTQEAREKADYARQAQLADYAREDVMAGQANLASYQQQQYGAIDAGIGMVASAAMSDRKEKKNIKKVGKTKDGVPVSEFEYKDKEDAPKGPGKYKGVIAQDLVGTKHEGAVKKIGKNTLGVNYGKLDIKLGKISGGKLKDKMKRFARGGVTDDRIYNNKELAERAGDYFSKNAGAGEPPREFRYYDENGNIKSVTYSSLAAFNKKIEDSENKQNQESPRDGSINTESDAIMYEKGGVENKDQMDAGEAEVTPGKFSHKENPIDLIQKNGEEGKPEKIGEMTGGEAIVPPKNVKQMRKMIENNDGESLVKLMDRLLTKWDKEAKDSSESEAEFGKTMAKHGAVHKPRVPSGKQKFKFRSLGRSSIGKL